jgi:hypothetical protein
MIFKSCHGNPNRYGSRSPITTSIKRVKLLYLIFWGSWKLLTSKLEGTSRKGQAGHKASIHLAMLLWIPPLTNLALNLLKKQWQIDWIIHLDSLKCSQCAVPFNTTKWNHLTEKGTDSKTNTAKCILTLVGIHSSNLLSKTTS